MVEDLPERSSGQHSPCRKTIMDTFQWKQSEKRETFIKPGTTIYIFMINGSVWSASIRLLLTRLLIKFHKELYARKRFNLMQLFQVILTLEPLVQRLPDCFSFPQSSKCRIIYSFIL